MGPRAEHEVREPASIATEKTPLLGGDSPVAVLLPFLAPLRPGALGAKELDEFVHDPAWVRTRAACFFSCWLLFFVALLAALALAGSKCAAAGAAAGVAPLPLQPLSLSLTTAPP